MRVWWLLRRAQQILTEDLKGIEDIFIRNTDSVLDYPTFGIALEGMPTALLEKRIAVEQQRDLRSAAIPYYRMYLAQSLINKGRSSEARELLQKVIADSREKFDAALKREAMLAEAILLSSDSERYAKLSEGIFFDSRAALRNAGLTLPVNYHIADSSIVSQLARTNLQPTAGSSLEYVVDYNREGTKHVFGFRSKQGLVPNVRVSGDDLVSVLHKFRAAVFSEQLP